MRFKITIIKLRKKCVLEKNILDSNYQKKIKTIPVDKSDRKQLETNQMT